MGHPGRRAGRPRSRGTGGSAFAPEPERVRQLGVEVLARVEDGARTSDALQVVLQDARGLSRRARGQLADAVYDAVAQSRWYDFALQAGLREDLPIERRLEARWVAARLLREGAPSGPRSAQRGEAELVPEVDWPAVLDAPSRLQALEPVERLAVRRSLPDWLAQRLIDQYGAEEADRLAAGFLERAPQSIRANRARTTREALAARLAEEEGVATVPCTFATDGLRVITRTNLFRLASFHEGLFEVQDEGSQLVGEVVAPPPGSAVIDACAGAGGKTLHIAALLGGKGRVLAFDVPEAEPQLSELRRRARRAGLSNVTAGTWDGASPAPVARVLVDAPCSGVGSFRRNPDARRRLTEEAASRLAGQQLAILERAAQLVRPGGRLIYATCTVLAAENDDVVARFLERNPAFVVMPLKEVLGRERAESIGDGTFLRVFPHRHGTDGFFAAVLRKPA